jgi:F-type H+-transporting ATPase subunit delta
LKSSSFNQTFVEPYAEALMSLAKEQGLVEALDHDVQLVLGSLQGSEELRHFLAVPLIKGNAKKSAINSLFGEQVNPLTLKFLMLVVDRGRIAFLQPICAQFQNLLREMNQIALADVTSAVPLTDEQQETLRRKVMDMTSARGVELAIKVNPDLIGGVIIKVGSQVVDASIRGQLRRLTSNLSVSSY